MDVISQDMECIVSDIMLSSDTTIWDHVIGGISLEYFVALKTTKDDKKLQWSGDE